MVDIILPERYYDAQVAVLGSILIDAACLPVVMTATSAEDFITPQYAAVYSAARRLWLARCPVDPVTVVAEAGADYEAIVRQAVEVTPTAANAAAYCKILREDATLYRLRCAAAEILGAPDLDAARKAYLDAERLTVKPGSRRVGLVQGLTDWYNEMSSDTPPAYLDWGMDKLNRNISVTAGDFVVLGADSSVGKTAFAVQIAVNLARSGKRVAIYSAETGAPTLYRRLVAQRAGIPLPAQQQKLIGKSGWGKVVQLIRECAPMTLDIVDASDMELPEIRADIIAHGYQVVIIDYLQLLDAPGHSSSEEVRYISKYLRKLTRALDVVVIGLSQLTVPDDAPDDWRPTRESLRESRQLKNDADVILLMYLASRKAPSGNRWLETAKQKEGTLGRINLTFTGAQMWFEPYETPRDKKASAEQQTLPGVAP